MTPWREVLKPEVRSALYTVIVALILSVSLACCTTASDTAARVLEAHAY